MCVFPPPCCSFLRTEAAGVNGGDGGLTAEAEVGVAGVNYSRPLACGGKLKLKPPNPNQLLPIRARPPKPIHPPHPNPPTKLIAQMVALFCFNPLLVLWSAMMRNVFRVAPIFYRNTRRQDRHRGRNIYRTGEVLEGFICSWQKVHLTSAHFVF